MDGMSNLATLGGPPCPLLPLRSTATYFYCRCGAHGYLVNGRVPVHFPAPPPAIRLFRQPPIPLSWDFPEDAPK